MTGAESITKFGPTGQIVYDRTYSRKLPDGSNETWPDTVRRVARGNLELVYGEQAAWPQHVINEYCLLVDHMEDFRIIPAGRHLWASGVKGRQYLMNCWVSGWGEKLSDHFEFTFLRLMEGGGVGANYSSTYLEAFGAPRRELRVHIVCDPSHADYEEMKAAGILSTEFDSDWHGAFEVGDSREGWADALVDLLDTYMTDDVVKHQDRVYDVTNVRPKGARLKTFGGTASGPGPFGQMMLDVAVVMNGSYLNAQEYHGFHHISHVTPIEAMEIDHAIASCVVSGGVRRSARMAICHWRDPYIEDFLACKADGSKHWTTNISVEIDDDFLALLNYEEGDKRIPFHLKGEAGYAKRVHQLVVEGMLTNGEPGYWNSSLSNEGEPGRVIATNPCGEITLEAWEACNLGHVNLDAFAPKVKGEPVDLPKILLAHELMTRFLIRATWADINDPKSRKIQDSNRRIGVGHLGVQGFWVKQGVRYSVVPETQMAPLLLDRLRDMVRQTAREYAFELRIPEPVKVTTVAPTGSIAKLPGVPEGIHPIYARYFLRRVRFSVLDPDQADKLLEFAHQGLKIETDVYDQSGNTMVVEFPTKDILVEQVEALGYPADIVIESADELTLDQLLAFQEMYQTHYADNAVSFTANVPPGLDVQEVADVVAARLPSLKGTTIMVDNTREQAPYERISEADYLAATVRTIEDGIDENCATGACPIR